MSKPICKITLKDILDYLDKAEPGENELIGYPETQSQENPMKGWLSLEDAAFFLETDVESLQASMVAGVVPENRERLPLIFRSPDWVQ